MNQRKKVNQVISICPVCEHNLKVVKLSCDHCDTIIEGNFSLSKFNYLKTDQLYFIEVFIKNRGNIKAIEKELNISYPTVKKMLDDAIINLGYPLDNSFEEEIQVTPKKEEGLSKANVLDKIATKEITVSEAVKLLQKK